MRPFLFLKQFTDYYPECPGGASAWGSGRTLTTLGIFILWPVGQGGRKMSISEGIGLFFINEALGLGQKPKKRLTDNIQKIRQISADLEAGKSVDPKKLKKLAGSLDYWADKLAGVVLTLIFNPEMMIGAACEVQAMEAYVERKKCGGRPQAAAQGGAA
jgi:hypothetical protein